MTMIAKTKLGYYFIPDLHFTTLPKQLEGLNMPKFTKTKLGYYYNPGSPFTTPSKK